MAVPPAIIVESREMNGKTEIERYRTRLSTELEEW
jgi:hypothetical protein